MSHEPSSQSPREARRVGSRTPLGDSDYDPLSWPAPLVTARAEPKHNDVVASPAAESPSKKRIAVVLRDSPAKAGSDYVQIQESAAPDVVGSSLPGSGTQDLIVSQQPEGTGSATTYSSGRGRGRPKGWKPGMSYAVMRGDAPVTTTTTATTTPIATATPTPTKARRGRPVTAAALRSARASRPRPQPQPHPQTHHAGDGKRRRGRPPKVSSTPPRHIFRQLSPELVAYLCEWAGCKAELHNLDTLRRHVLAIHVRSGPAQCRWGRCGEANERNNNGDEPSHALDKQQLARHMEEAHLVPLSWHVGDGPRNSLGGGRTDDDTVPDFLKDAQGRQVTPWVRDQRLEDHATWKNNRRKLKELLQRRNENLPDEESTSGEEMMPDR